MLAGKFLVRMLRKLILLTVVLSLGAVLISPCTDLDDVIHHHQSHHHHFGTVAQQSTENGDWWELSAAAPAEREGTTEAVQTANSTLRC